MKKYQSGFSLIELLIVVVIIGIIAAIAIPNLLAARRSANEGSAFATMRAILSAEYLYASTRGEGSYGTLTDLGNATLVDRLIGSSAGEKSGYRFNVERVDRVNTTPASLSIGAIPIIPSGVAATGTRKFCINNEGLIYSYVQADLTVTPAISGSNTTPATCESNGTQIQ